MFRKKYEIPVPKPITPIAPPYNKTFRFRGREGSAEKWHKKRHIKWYYKTRTILHARGVILVGSRHRLRKIWKRIVENSASVLRVLSIISSKEKFACNGFTVYGRIGIKTSPNKKGKFLSSARIICKNTSINFAMEGSTSGKKMKPGKN